MLSIHGVVAVDGVLSAHVVVLGGGAMDTNIVAVASSIRASTCDIRRLTRIVEEVAIT